MGTSTTWSRRGVLVAGAAAAGAAALAGPLGSAASAASASGGGTVGLRRAHWTPLVGSRVTVAGPAGTVRPVVVEVADLRSAAAGDPARFAVVLRTDPNQTIAGLNPVTIPGRGVATLLVSGIERVQRHRYFEIVVNNPAA